VSNGRFYLSRQKYIFFYSVGCVVVKNVWERIHTYICVCIIVYAVITYKYIYNHINNKYIYKICACIPKRSEGKNVK
jgi:hypothetical protein